MPVLPPSRRPADLTDASEVAALEQRLQGAADKLAGMVEDYGKAKQIIEFASDRRKRSLAKSTVTFLDNGESAASAEAHGRACFSYGEELKGLELELREAETVKSNWEATRIVWESCRSLLSMQRELAKI